MNRIPLACVVAVLASVGFASDNDDLLALAEAQTNLVVQNTKTFTTMPLCKRVEGTGFVRKPGGEWEPAEEGRFYPFGFEYRAGKDSMLVVAFGASSSATVKNGAAFGTRAQALGVKSRTIYPISGLIELKLADNMPQGAFVVAAPGFTVVNPAGASRINYRDVGDGDEATVRCLTGSLAIEGRHFGIADMSSADEIRIRTSRDHLCTFLYGTSGDYVVKVDQGRRLREEFAEDGRLKMVVEKADLDWHLTPSTKILISRSVPSVGEKMSVHTMAFDAMGERKSECSFCETRAELNSGELVPKSKVSSEELAKRADEMTAEKPAEGGNSSEETPAAEESDSNDNNNTNEE